MKISLEWLQQYLPGSLDAQTAANALTNGGLPVEVIERVEEDTVIDVEVTSNRGDCLSHVGVARELAALLGREFRPVGSKEPQVLTLAVGGTSVQLDEPTLCPHYTARVIRGVKVGPSPLWMQKRLESVGLRPINNIVDVTNYVLFELGQPLHAFDLDRLEGGRIVVRRARAGEKLMTLDGKEHELTPDMLTIADSTSPVALAGVMGGQSSEVTDRTVNVLLESARFDPLSIRKTARALQMRSDSSYRFERGIDPILPVHASSRAVELILQSAGGDAPPGIVEAGQSGYSPKVLTLRLARMQQLLGVAFPTNSIMDALTRLQLSPVLKGDHIEVTVPRYRLDLNLEVDLIEEAARVIGYDKVPVRDEIAIRLQPAEPQRRTVETIRSTTVAAGYFEAVTFSFVTDSLAGFFVPPEADPNRPLPRTSALVRKADAALRPSILPGLLQAVRYNESVGTSGAKVYEIGSTFWNVPGGERVEERRRLGIVGSTDYREVRGVVERLLNRLDGQRPVRITPVDRPGFARGAAGRIEWGGETIGYIGKIDRAVADVLSLREPPAAAELDLPPLLAGAQHVPQQSPLPKYPAVDRDLSFVLPENISYAALESAVLDAKPEMLETLRYVTTFRGKQVPPGHKSVTIRLVFRSPSETLTSEKVEASIQRVIEAATKNVNATLRA